MNALMGRYYNNEITKDELTAWVNAMGYISNIKIYILNPDATTLKEIEGTDVLSSDGQLKSDIKKVMDGETIKRMNPFNISSSSDVAYIGMPLKYNEQISGVILLFSPITDLNNILKSALITIVSIIIITILIGTLAILRISIRISEPIVEISEYAKKIGKGINVPDIDVESRDEIGLLANSFNEMKKEIAVAEKMRKEIVANVSHELRTPLTSIIGFIKGILDGVIPKEEEEKYLSIAYDEANRLKELTKDIVDIAKLESGNIKLNKRNVLINEIIKEVYIEFEELVKEKNLDFIFEEIDENVSIYADSDRIKQVLINIINNSLKFTSSGYIKINLRKYLDKAKIVIEDTGIGIEKDKIAYLFNKFYTANEYGNATSGAGLGLNIAKNIIDLHGGDIKIESIVEKGTTVTIII
jgi:signal transduction histidine kinase